VRAEEDAPLPALDNAAPPLSAIAATAAVATPTRPRALGALAAAVLLLAVSDARHGDAEAAAWVTDPASVEFWCQCAGRDPREFARRVEDLLRRLRNGRRAFSRRDASVRP